MILCKKELTRILVAFCLAKALSLTSEPVPSPAYQKREEVTSELPCAHFRPVHALQRSCTTGQPCTTMYNLYRNSLTHTIPPVELPENPALQRIDFRGSKLTPSCCAKKRAQPLVCALTYRSKQQPAAVCHGCPWSNSRECLMNNGYPILSNPVPHTSNQVIKQNHVQLV